MKRKTFVNAIIFAFAILLIVLAFLIPTVHGATLSPFIGAPPKPPTNAFAYSLFRTAPLEVAKVFGRTPGCADADAAMIESTARAAAKAGLDPAIAAATVGIESGCNQFAVSARGAVGIMQIMARVWSGHYDFAGNVNLFNRDDNLRVGTQIEAGLISQYGTAEGIRRYNGTGTDCQSCDPTYANKILTLAGRRQ